MYGDLPPLPPEYASAASGPPPPRAAFPPPPPAPRAGGPAAAALRAAAGQASPTRNSNSQETGTARGAAPFGRNAALAADPFAPLAAQPFAAAAAAAPHSPRTCARQPASTPLPMPPPPPPSPRARGPGSLPAAPFPPSRACAPRSPPLPPPCELAALLGPLPGWALLEGPELLPSLSDRRSESVAPIGLVPAHPARG
jgi:hypothetical protein